MVISDNREPTASDHGDVLYDIGKSDRVGRYMVARRTISPEEMIFTDQPAVVGPDNSAIPMCLVCWRKVSGVFVCDKCGWPLCGESCRDTKSHSKECSFFQEKKTKVHVTAFGIPNKLYDAILPLRLLLLKKTNKSVFRLISLLMGHTEELSEKKQRRYTRLTNLIRNSWGFGQDFSAEEVKHVLGILDVNSFVIHDGVEDSTGLIGLYPWTSLMSHCCVPNIKISTKDDFSYVCESTVSIKKGDEIVTSYHHYYYHLYGTMYRRSDIRRTWKFDCICHRCKDPSELGTMVSAIRCKSCNGFLLPIQPLDYGTNWRCSNCNTVRENKEMESMIEKLEFDIDSIPGSAAEQLEQRVTDLVGTLHENHYLITECKRRLLDIYGHEERFEYGNLTESTIKRKMMYCDQLLELASILSPGKSELRGYLLWEKYTATHSLLQKQSQNGEKYIDSLQNLCSNLREIVEIFGKIRADSVEGANAIKAKCDLSRLEQQIQEILDDEGDVDH